MAVCVCRVLFRPKRHMVAWLRPMVAGAGDGREMDETELARRLELLRMEHRDLDAAIAALSETGSSDVLQIARLKKRKLRLKDEISQIQDWLVPDIIA